jgi:DNA-binding transcriptional LysR family regulator
MHNVYEWLMDILHSMTVFVAVVEQGSLVRAAEGLGMSAAAVSRQIAALEDHLSARLLNRTTRQLSVTDIGQDYVVRARQILSDVGEAEATAGRGAAQATGVLKVSAPISFGVNRLSRWLPAFRAAHPLLRLDLDLTDRQIDLASEGVDVAVRIARKLSTPHVIARRIGRVRQVVCAAPAYLDRHGRPQTPEDLVTHDTLCFSHLAGGDVWTFRRDGAQTVVRLRPSFHASSGDMLCELAVGGAGIIYEPDFIVARHIESGCLEPLLTDWQSEDFGIHALYLSRRYLSAKVRLFIDALEQAEKRPVAGAGQAPLVAARA